MADTFHVLQQQIAAKIETVAGTAVALAAADVKLRPLQSSLSFSPEFLRFANDEVADDLGTAPDFVAGKAGRIGCGFILKSSGVVGTVPAIGVFLKACGCKEEVVRTIDIDAPSGGTANFVPGSAWVFGGGAKTGTVVGSVRQITITDPTGGAGQFTAGDSWSTTNGKSGYVETTIAGAGTFKYFLWTGSEDLDADDVIQSKGATATTAGSSTPVAGKFRFTQSTGAALAATDLILASGSSATASGTNTLLAVRYTPRSQALSAITLHRGIKNFNGTTDQDFLERLRGTRGTFTLDLASLDVARAIFDFQGVVDGMEAAALLSGVTYESSTAPALINSTLTIGGVLVKPAAIQFDAGVETAMEPDPTTEGGTAGYLEAYVSRREPKLTMDPFRIPPATFDDLALLSSGAQVPVSIVWGTSPNQIELQIAKAQLRDSTEASRANLMTRNLTLNCVRNSVLDQEWALYFR